MRARGLEWGSLRGGSWKVSWVCESVSEWAVHSLRSPKASLEDPFQEQRGQLFLVQYLPSDGTFQRDLGHF